MTLILLAGLSPLVDCLFHEDEQTGIYTVVTGAPEQRSCLSSEVSRQSYLSTVSVKASSQPYLSTELSPHAVLTEGVNDQSYLSADYKSEQPVLPVYRG